MKIFYTATFSGKKTYQKYIDMVLLALEKTGAEIISPEKNNYKKILSIRERLKWNEKPKIEHYEAIRKDIAAADAVVMEVSYHSFQLGHEATLAIQAKKPVLCLSLEEDYADKIKNRFFYGAKYNEDNIDEIVADFVNKIKKEQLGQRFNCFLSAGQTEYLKKKAESEEMTVSEYVRKLIDQDRQK
jgi:hypothetical protein